MKSLLNFLRTDQWNPNYVQSAVLYGSMILSIGINFITSIFTARALLPAVFGDMNFVDAVWALLAVFVTIGAFHAGSRLLLIEQDREKFNEIIGLVLLIALTAGIVLTALTVLLAYPLDIIFHAKLAKNFIILSPFLIAFPMRDALVLILQSTNKIYRLALINVSPTFLYLIYFIFLYQLHQINLTTVLTGQLVTVLVVAVAISFSLKPKFRSLPEYRQLYLNRYIDELKRYGWPVFLGSLASTASGYLNRLALSFWVNNTALGYFSLASSMTDPLKLLPNAVATSSFRNFVHQKKVPRKLFLVTASIAGLSLVAAWVFFKFFLSFFYTENFAQVSPMGNVLAIGAVLWGFGDFFNRFLGAHGLGSNLRNTAMIIGVVNIIGFVTLLPLFGVAGALATIILSSVLYLGLMLFYYLEFGKQKYMGLDIPEEKTTVEQAAGTSGE